MEYFMGIDIGTYESKGVIVTRDGHVVAQAARPHGLSIPRPGWAEHDADGVWWSDFCNLSQELLQKSGLPPASIAGVAASAIGPCMLPVDREGRPLRPAILYGIDTRAHQEIEELNQLFGPEKIRASCGSYLSSQAVGPKILWFRKNEPELYARTARIMTATSYLVMKLTGRVVMDYYTAGSWHPLLNLHTLQWDSDFCKPICPPDMLPDLDWSPRIAGRVTAEASRQTGLVEGTPVAVSTVDAAAEAVSCGVTSPGDLMLMYGTTLFFIHVTEQYTPTAELWPLVYLEPGTWAQAAGMATTGALTRWFRDQFGFPELEREKAGGENAYASLAKLAADSPCGSRGLITLPYFSGERTPINDPKARGVIAGLTLSHTRGDVYRSILEGTAYGVRHNLEAMAATGHKPRRLVAVGGGTRNDLWLQIVSDVTGQPQEVPSTTIGASYGDAFLAATAVGMYKHLEDVHRWVQIDRTVVPRKEATTLYDSYYSVYRSLYLHMQEDMHRLADLSSITEG